MCGSRVTFDDLLTIAKGGDGLTSGIGPSRLERVATVGEWETTAAALRQIFRQTLGQTPDVVGPYDLGK